MVIVWGRLSRAQFCKMNKLQWRWAQRGRFPQEVRLGWERSQQKGRRGLSHAAHPDWSMRLWLGRGHWPAGAFHVPLHVRFPNSGLGISPGFIPPPFSLRLLPHPPLLTSWLYAVVFTESPTSPDQIECLFWAGTLDQPWALGRRRAEVQRCIVAFKELGGESWYVNAVILTLRSFFKMMVKKTQHCIYRLNHV